MFSLVHAIENAREPIDPSIHPGFCLLYRRAVPRLMRLIADGALTTMDLTVLLQLASRVRPASGYAVTSVRGMAAERNASITSVAHSLRRLHRAGIVCRLGHKQARACYALNPEFVTTGCATARSMSAQAFDQAMSESQPPAPVTEGAVRARHALPQHLQAG